MVRNSFEMKSTRFWSPKKRAIAVTLRNEGYTYAEIAKRIGGKATHSGVLKVCKKFQETKSVADKGRSGRRRKSNDREDRNLVRLCLNDRQKTSRDLRDEWNPEVSTSTVRRRLIFSGLKGRIPRKKPLLNKAQRSKRLKWAHEHKNWTVEQWARVLWSDESKISIFGTPGVHYIRRRTKEELNPDCLVPTMKHPVHIMIWGCMSSKGVGRLHICQGIVNGMVYRDEILGPKMLPSARSLFREQDDTPDAVPMFVFQQDNAPCHTARIVQKWFTDNGISTLDWPGNSPDLNPIENLWSRLKRLVAKKKPSCRRELIESVLHCWNHVITMQELEHLVASMPTRCLSVIRAKGYPTKY